MWGGRRGEGGGGEGGEGDGSYIGKDGGEGRVEREEEGRKSFE